MINSIQEAVETIKENPFISFVLIYILIGYLVLFMVFDSRIQALEIKINEQNIVQESEAINESI